MGVGGEPTGAGEELDGVDSDSDARVDMLGVEEPPPTPPDASRWMWLTTKHLVVEVEESCRGRHGRREIRSFLFPFCRHRAKLDVLIQQEQSQLDLLELVRRVMNLAIAHRQ